MVSQTVIASLYPDHKGNTFMILTVKVTTLTKEASFSCYHDDEYIVDTKCDEDAYTKNRFSYTHTY